MPKECFDWFLEYIVTGRYAEPYIRSLLNFTVHLNSTILNIINLDLLHISWAEKGLVVCFLVEL